MGRRDTLISNSILRAIFHSRQDKKSILGRILTFFGLFQLTLARYRDELFKKLRDEVWGLDEDEYRESFRSSNKKASLKAVGDLGYSGSTFFTTPNGKFLIKSLPRPSEYNFFANDLLMPYYEHMSHFPTSLLVRITDFLYAPYASLGSILSLAPPCHIIMENILYGKTSAANPDAWETYDLKPVTYFYPERDIAGGHLASDSVKERLLDTFEDKVRIGEQHRIQLLTALQEDTSLLCRCNVVDYSLFLVRYPAFPAAEAEEIPVLTSKASPWRTGVPSTDGKWIYRAVVLDFFWAKHKFQAMAMTGLINSFNFFARKGPMSITTDAEEYRERFLKMVEAICESEESREGRDGGRR